MNIQITIETPNFRFIAESDNPQDAVTLLEMAMLREGADGAARLPVTGEAKPVLAEPPAPSSKAPKEKKAKETEKAAEKPQDAPAAVAAPATPSTPPQAPPSAAPAPNGHPTPPTVDAIRKATIDAVTAAIGRNRPGVEALLKEFGVSRFRDLGDDPAVLQKFGERVKSV